MKDAATLSHVQAQIAELIAWGGSKKQIAEKLNMPIRTVEGHTRDIYNKVGVSKSNELSAWWFCTRYNIPFTDYPLI